MKAMSCGRRAGRRGRSRPRSLRTGMLSPVKADSAISRVADCRRRPSAGTLSPASNDDDVAGHELVGRESVSSPPRRACALMIIIFCSAATLSAALPSWSGRARRSTPSTGEARPGARTQERGDAHDGRAQQDELHQVAVLAQERAPARLGAPPRRAVGPVLLGEAARRRRPVGAGGLGATPSRAS